MSARTPGPWAIVQIGTQCAIAPILDSETVEGEAIASVYFPNYHPDGLAAAREEQRANAAFIVEACNAHDALRSDLAEAVALLRSLQGVADSMVENLKPNYTGNLKARMLLCTVSARALLARLDSNATGKDRA